MAVYILFLVSQVFGDCPSECFGKPCTDDCYSYCSISCESYCSHSCTLQMLGNTLCEEECNTAECNYDMGDCHLSRKLTTVKITNTTQITESTQIAPYNYGKVAGVGLGVFLTIMMIIFGVILCVIGTATPVFFVFLLLGILIPLITFLIVALAPLHKTQAVQTDTRTDGFVTARILFLVAMIIFALLAFIKMFEYQLGINLRAKGVNSNIPQLTAADLTQNMPENAENRPENNPLLRAPQNQTPPPNPFVPNQPFNQFPN